MSLTTITDWLSFRAVTPVEKVRSYVELPAFTYAASWVGASEIATQFNFTASKNFVLRNRPTPPSGVNFCLCIRYRVGDVVYRWKLWQEVGEVLNVPLYNGETIKKNFVLECWTLRDATTCSLSAAIRILTSVVTIPTDFRSLGMTALCSGTEYNKSAVAMTLNTLSLVTSNLFFRFESDTGVSLSGSDVTAWADQSGNGNHLIDDGSIKPLYNSGSAELNSLPMIQLIAGSRLSCAVANPSLCQTLFFVFRRRVAQTTRTYFELANNAGPTIRSYFKEGAANTDLDVQFNNGQTGTYASTIPTAGTTDPFYILHCVNSSTVFSYMYNMDLTALASLTAAVTFTGAPDRIYLGKGSASGNVAFGDVGAFIGYSSVLTADQITANLAYLKQKYNTGVGIFFPATINAGSAWLSND